MQKREYLHNFLDRGKDMWPGAWPEQASPERQASHSMWAVMFAMAAR